MADPESLIMEYLFGLFDFFDHTLPPSRALSLYV